MYALVTALHPDQDKKTRAIWDILATRCDLMGMQMFPLPHFSWQGAESYDLPGAREFLTEASRSLPPFRVKAAGLGLFTGKVPVLYIAVVKNRQLLDLHEYFWMQLSKFCKGPNPYYAPSDWMPHITIAYKDMTSEKLACAVEDILFMPVDFEIDVSSIAIVHANSDDVGIDWSIDFGERSS